MTDLRERLLEEIYRRLLHAYGLRGCCGAGTAEYVHASLRALRREVERHTPRTPANLKCHYCDWEWPCPTITDTAKELEVKP